MKLFLFLIFAYSSFYSIGQSISGKVFDFENNAVEYASVRLLHKADSSVYQGVYTSIDGGFSFSDLEKGEYILKITFSLLEPFVENISILDKKDIDLGNLILNEDAVLEVEGAVVTGSTDALKAGIDKKVYNTSEDISTRGGSVVDVLANIPSISVDQDGNVSLRGDANVIILIDGRPSALALGDGQNLLSALPANSVERIEIVTNPSAKYDPDGTSGIINIVLKKNKLKGFNGLASVTAATGNLYEASFALSYRNSKMNLYTNYSFNYYEGYRNFESSLDRTLSSDSITSFQQQRDGTDLKSTNTLILGSDFYLSKRSTLGLSATGTLGKRERTGDLNNYFYDGDGVLNDYWVRTSLDPRKSNNFNANANFTRKNKEDKGEFSINVNQTFGKKFIQGFYEENYYDVSGNLSLLAPLNQQLENKEYIAITTAQTDYSYILTKINARIETGGKAIIETNNVSSYSETRDTLSGDYFQDTLSNFDYEYNQQVYSVYAIFGQELGKFKYQGGLRGEYAEQNPFLKSTGEKFNNTYVNLFPSGHLKYNPSKKTELSLSYSRRINRAKARQLNPFTSYADPFNLRKGNPELQPEYINSFDLGYSYAAKKFIFTTSIFHRRTSDVINRVKYYNDDNTSYVTYDNIDKSISTGGELIVIYKPTKWMKNTVSWSGNYIDYTNADTTVDWNNSGFNWGLKYALGIDFWNRTAKVQLNVNYRAPITTAQGIVQPRGNVDITLEKSILKKKLIFVIKVSDIFNTKGFELNLYQDPVRQQSEYKWLTRRLYGTVVYKFGNMETKLKVPKSSSGGGMD